MLLEPPINGRRFGGIRTKMDADPPAVVYMVHYLMRFTITITHIDDANFQGLLSQNQRIYTVISLFPYNYLLKSQWCHVRSQAPGAQYFSPEWNLLRQEQSTMPG